MLTAAFSSGNGKAIDPLIYRSARSQGMADARVMLGDEWSVLGNPAGLTSLTGASFGICYENYYLISDLGLGAFSVALPTKTGTFGFGFTTFGYSSYRESRVTLSYGKAFGRKLMAGISLNYMTIHQPNDCGNLNALVPALGIQVLPIPELTLGLQVFNPASQHYVPEGYLVVPQIFQAGLGYKLGDELLVCFEADKTAREKIICSGGVEITLRKQFLIRMGISSSETRKFSFGVGYRSRLITLDLAFAKHPLLGFNPAAGISFRIK